MNYSFYYKSIYYRFFKKPKPTKKPVRICQQIYFPEVHKGLKKIKAQFLKETGIKFMKKFLKVLWKNGASQP